MSDINAEKIGQVINNPKGKVEQHIHNYANQPTLPNSLRTTINFIGREEHLNKLRESYQKGSRCFVLHGTGGVGKTALALQFAEEIASEYAAKIRVDMNGMNESPLSARDAMFNVIREFERQISADIPDAQLKNLFAQFVQNQTTLIVLDNAASKESVEFLMDVRACFITTSREAFDLTGGESWKILQMLPEDARKLLFENGGGERRFEGRAEELAELAGYLPMALKTLASILKEDELETAADLIEQYRDKKELLKERVPDYNNLTIEASFELSYEVLSDEMKERWRRLSVFPADFDQTAITAILNISADKAKAIQKRLRRFSLLEVNTKTRRFNLHDLIRVFVDTKLSDDERFEVQLLHARYYSLIPQKAHEIKLKNTKDSYLNALSLIDSEWENIVAGQRWAASLVEQNEYAAMFCLDYSGTGRELIKLRLHLHENIKWLESGLIAARLLNSPTSLANHLTGLGIAHKDLGKFHKSNDEYRKAIQYYEQALPIHRSNLDWTNICKVLCNLGNIYLLIPNYLEAEKCCEESLKLGLRITDEYNCKENECGTLSILGHISLGRERCDEAIGFFNAALAHSNENPLIGSKILGSLGDAYGNLGNYNFRLRRKEESLNNYKKSGEYSEKALRIADELKDRRGINEFSEKLILAGSACMRLSDEETACHLWKQAITILQKYNLPKANEYQEMIREYCKN